MLYLSQVQGRKVWDAWNRPVGRCADILVKDLEQRYPPVVALALKDHGAPAQLIPAEQISELFPNVVLKVPSQEIRPYAPTGHELPLGERIMDRQIVDTEGRRVVRVNDLQLLRMDERFRLTGVDVGWRGLLRRMGIEGPASAMARRLRRHLPESIIPWEDVAPLQDQDPLRLRISRDRISELPPADIAAILNDLDLPTSHALMARMTDETLADTLEESPTVVQVAALSQLDPQRAADVLEEMAPDEAADLLADLPAETSARLLELMEDEDAEDVQALLGYPEESAGGIMTTEFAWVPAGLRAGEALDHLRTSMDAQEDEVMHYVYTLDGEDRLQGVVSLRDLVMAPQDQPMAALIDDSPVTVDPLVDQDEVAYLIAKYDLLAIPVVHKETGAMLGIVTVDDAIDPILPTAWKKRLPRLY